jgi:CubicO group peptidase (beta-lactamase class C family)
VNLVWGRIGGLDETLGYRRAGATTALTPVAGRATVRVEIDVGASAYNVYVDHKHVESRIPLETPLTFDTVRFFSDGVNEAAFSGRSFDSVTIKATVPSGGTSNAAPVAAERLVRADGSVPTAITLSYSDGDGPGPYTFDIVDAPRHGTLGSDDGDENVVYSPRGDFIGTDRFTFRVHDGTESSALATMSIVVQNYPGASWETRTPEQVGLNAARLEQLAQSIGGVGSIVRHGYVVKTWGDPTAKADWASTAKPMLNTLLFFAVQEKRIASIEDPVKDWVLAATGGTLRAEDETMTFAQLMNMTSGYAVIEPPGVAWAYNDVAVNLKNKLVGAIFGEPLDEHLRARLGALQLEDGALLTTRGGYGVSTTTRDFARIAWFWLNRGNWRGQQILDEKFFDAYMRTQVPGATPRTAGPDADYLNAGTAGGDQDQSEHGPGHFGASWWFNDAVGTTGLRPWPDAPLDTIQAHGHWGREMVVMIPSLNLVVATRGTWGSSVPGDRNSGVNQRLRILVAAAAEL